MIFKNTCGNKRVSLNTLSSLITRHQNSSCISQRIAACQAFVRSTTPWSPFPTAYTQLVVGNGTTGCASIAISNVQNLATYNYAGVAIRFNSTLISQNRK